ncbi:MAG TPA: hypothetical protein VKG21_22155 [Casimicrobiaceae bacterium]|nr:hypothetical protein [Casimicrobiaceae bacterium]
MKNGGAHLLQWRQLIVDVATGLATVLVVAATAASTVLPFSVFIACALVGVAWMLERSTDARSARYVTVGSLRRRSGFEPARSGTLAQHFDAPVVDATSR